MEYETREAAEAAVLHWDKGQLDGEVVEAVFITKITRPPPPTERPVRARVPTPPPRRGGRNRASPPRRRTEGNCTSLGKDNEWCLFRFFRCMLNLYETRLDSRSLFTTSPRSL